MLSENERNKNLAHMHNTLHDTQISSMKSEFQDRSKIV